MLRHMTMRAAGLALGLSGLVLGCSADPRVCTAAGISDSLYVDARAVGLTVDSVRVCLPDDCYGPVKLVEGRAFPLPGGVGYLPSEAVDVEVELLDMAGQPLAEAQGRVEETVTSMNVDEDGDTCGPVGRAARIRVSEDGRSFQQVPLDAA